MTGKQPFASLLMISICQILEEVHRPCRLLEQQHIQLAFRKYLVHHMVCIMFNTCETAAELDPVEQRRFCTCLHTYWAKFTSRSWVGHQGTRSKFLAEAWDFPPPRSIQTNYGTHSPFYSVGTKSLLPWGAKEAKAWSWPVSLLPRLRMFGFKPYWHANNNFSFTFYTCSVIILNDSNC